MAREERVTNVNDGYNFKTARRGDNAVDAGRTVGPRSGLPRKQTESPIAGITTGDRWKVSERKSGDAIRSGPG